MQGIAQLPVAIRHGFEKSLTRGERHIGRNESLRMFFHISEDNVFEDKEIVLAEVVEKRTAFLIQWVLSKGGLHGFQESDCPRARHSTLPHNGVACPSRSLPRHSQRFDTDAKLLGEINQRGGLIPVEVRGRDVQVLQGRGDGGRLERLQLTEEGWALVKSIRTGPTANIPAGQTAVRLCRVPWPIRQTLWWSALNFFGPTRCLQIGTFSITSAGSRGSGILNLPSLLTSKIHFSMLDPADGLESQLSFDHRMLGGIAAALALADLESVLLGETLRERTSSPVRLFFSGVY